MVTSTKIDPNSTKTSDLQVKPLSTYLIICCTLLLKISIFKSFTEKHETGT